MAEAAKLKVDISEEELTSALMQRHDPVAARGVQAMFETQLKYYGAFMQAWTDMSGRVLERATDRVRAAAQSPSLEEQSRLIGRHSVEELLHLAEEGARFSHQCMVLMASMAKARHMPTPNPAWNAGDGQPTQPAPAPGTRSKRRRRKASGGAGTESS